MRSFSKFVSKKLRSPKAKKPQARLHLEYLEDRRVPTAVVFAGFVPNTAILNIQEVFSANSPSNGPGSSLTISGNTAAGTGGPTSMVTITGGFETTINGMNAVTFTTLFPGAITAINVTVLNDNETIIVGTPTGIINLPGTTLNVTVGSGNDTLIMGTAGTPGGLGTGGVSEVNNVLNAVNFKSANINSTGNERVSAYRVREAPLRSQLKSIPNGSDNSAGMSCAEGELAPAAKDRTCAASVHQLVIADVIAQFPIDVWRDSPCVILPSSCPRNCDPRRPRSRQRG